MPTPAIASPAPSPPHGWRQAIFLALGFWFLYAFVASSSTLFDRDEPRFARAAVEMVESGNYLYPTFNGEIRAHKPILIYWLMAVPLHLLGQSELAVRLPSTLGVLGSLLLTYWIGRRHWNHRVGVTAMIVLATTPIMQMVGTAATADGTLLFFLTACLAVLAEAMKSGSRWSLLPPFALALAAAQLTKGPVGLAVPLLALLATTWMQRRAVSSDESANPRRLSWPLAAAATLISTAAFLAWAYPANEATRGVFAKEGVGKHLVERVLNPMESHGGNWFLYLPYYIPIVIGGFFPWSLFLLGTGSAVWTGRAGGRVARPLLAGWALPTFAIMSVVATKLPHYILPIWPALALAVAVTIDAHHRNTLSEKDRILLHRGGILFAPVAFGATITLAALPFVVHAPAMRAPCITLSAMIAVLAILALREHLAFRFHRSAMVLAIGTPIIQFMLAAVGLPAFEELKPAPVIARAVRAATPADSPVTTLDFDEPSLYFYLDRGPINSNPGKQKVVQWVLSDEPGVLIVTRDVLNDLTAKHGTIPLREVGKAPGFNYSKGEWVDLIAVCKSKPTTDAAPPASTP